MIIVSHPTGNQNVRNVLSALYSKHLLALYITSVGFSSENHTGWLPKKIRSELNRRSYKLPPNLIQSYPVDEIMRQMSLKMGWRNLVRHEIGRFSVDSVYRNLDRKAARALPSLMGSGINAVYCYEDCATETFRVAQAFGLRRVYDLPIAYWETSRKLLAEETERYPDWKQTLPGSQDSIEKFERKTAELELADVVVCPSEFVATSLPANAVKNKLIIVAPFGSPTSQVLPKPKKTIQNGSLRVLFAGSLTQRKGLADLFAAFKFLNRNDVELVVFGSPLLPLEFYRERGPAFTYESPRPHAQVLELMRSCDVLVLPSLVEGRALVIQEAMSQGLPVIITPNTGAADVVEEGRTGFVVPIRSPEQIALKLNWLADHKSALHEMAICSQKKAAEFTWARYRDTIARIFDYS